MKAVEDMRKIPVSRFKRELTSIMKRKEILCITVNGVETSVCCPEGTEEFDVVHAAHSE
jgi:hypothetical protein